MSKPFLMNCPVVMLCNQAGHCRWAASHLLGKGKSYVSWTSVGHAIRSWCRISRKCALCLQDEMCIAFALFSLLFSWQIFRDFSVKRYLGTSVAFLCALLKLMDLPADAHILLTDPTTAAHRRLVQWLHIQAGCLVHYRRIPLQLERDKECMCCAHFWGIVLCCLFLCIKQILATNCFILEDEYVAKQFLFNSQHSTRETL